MLRRRVAGFAEKSSSPLTLHEAASEMHPEWQGGQILHPPVKTSLEAISTQIFYITWIWGQK